ncbi:MAG: AAA family ATPase [Thermodesulfobacteriota bacterium]
MISTEEMIAALRLPEAYPYPVDGVEFIQTHISLLFFAGMHVYKIKRPIDLGFLDYRTLDKRRFFCREEVRLNRRLAPQTYLGVVPVTRGADGTVRIDGDGEVIDYAVKMIRLPVDRMMDELLGRGEIDNAMMRALAELLADFHGQAPTGPGVDEHGSPAAIRFNVEENFAQTRALVTDIDALERGTITRSLFSYLERVSLGYLDDHAGRLEKRVARGRIRDGHGDLHAGNICFIPEGIVIYDCIEFAPRFRCGDVAADLAFLVMDLDARGFRGFGQFLVHRYVRHSGDEALVELIPFYKLYRAYVRGKVASLRSLDESLDAQARTEARCEARGYFHLAASYALPPALILMCGLPASGKSWAARRIAAPFEACLFRSDTVRKRLAGIPPTHHGGEDFQEGIYTPEWTHDTYREILEEAGEALREGRTVVVDAMFGKADQRAPFIGLARSMSVPFVLVYVEVSEETTRRRMTERAKDAREVSDADWAIYLKARESLELPRELSASAWLRVSGDATGDEIVTALVDRLVGLGGRSLSARS